MFARRNSITLAIIWLLLLSIGIFWYLKDARQLVDVLKEQRNLSNILSTSQAEIKRLTELEKTHDELKEQWLNAPKVIISAEEPSFSLSYINWISSNNNLTLDYDFVLNEKKKTGNFTKFVYTLSGEGTYNDIYKLIWYLTYEPILYKINSISLSRTNPNSELLRFNMKLQGFTVDSESGMSEEFSEIRTTNGKTVRLQYDIFSPLVKPKPVVVKKAKPEKPKLPPKLPGEIDVEKAALKAVTNSSIFISEGNSGVVELRIGDRVYLGRLVGINQKTNEAEFIITKFGKSQRIILGIDQRK
jgi:Tfp pilus assembly protein PilO